MTRSRDPGDDEFVTIWGKQIHETLQGVLLEVEGGQEIWFPLSQVEESEPNQWTMPLWLAKKKGVV